MRVARHGNLVWAAILQLATRKLFHHVGIDGTGFEKRNAVLKANALIFHFGQARFLDGELAIDAAKFQHAARAPDGVIGEVQGGNGADRRYHQSAKEPRYTTPDSHDPNESRALRGVKALTHATGH